MASETMQDGNRTIFVNSIVEFVNTYDFIERLDIDWEYPGIQGAEDNIVDEDNDAANYETFIGELRDALDTAGKTNVTIAIASGAPQDKIDAAKLKNLVDAGVDSIHLMTYDFFGESWSEQLNHHTNLMSGNADDWSVDASVQYMINELQIPSENIQIGYANYSRNANTANITTEDPSTEAMEGTFTGDAETQGSWETGTTNINDLLKYYLQADESAGLSGINGYTLYTDTVANADYIYNEDLKTYISLDTPRSVYAKAQYVLQNNLGGIFTWMADYDEGHMLNAAHEGLGYPLEGDPVIDMDKIINTCGEGVNEQTCSDLTHLNDGTGPSNESPEILGIENTSISVGEEFEPMDGVTATDEEDGDLSTDIIVGGNEVNEEQAGDYTVTYSVTDSDDNTTEENRVVTVIDEGNNGGGTCENPIDPDAGNYDEWEAITRYRSFRGLTADFKYSYAASA